jgi:hypothetical protein
VNAACARSQRIADFAAVYEADLSTPTMILTLMTSEPRGCYRCIEVNKRCLVVGTTRMHRQQQDGSSGGYSVIVYTSQLLLTSARAPSSPAS